MNDQFELKMINNKVKSFVIARYCEGFQSFRSSILVPTSFYLLLPCSRAPLTDMTAMDGGNAIGLQGATLARVGDAEIGVFGVKISVHQLMGCPCAIIA